MIDQDKMTRARALIAGWGFDEVEYPDLFDTAMLSVGLAEAKSGEAVAKLGLAEIKEIESILQSKPNNVLTLDYLADKLPGVRREAQRLLALIYNLPWLKEISPKLIHPAMDSSVELKQKCDELNSILLKTPSGKGLLVFADYDSLSFYAQEGRVERMSDPVRSILGANPELGLAEQSQIMRYLKSDSDISMAVASAASLDNYWSAMQAKTEGERVLARVLDSAISRGATDVEISPRRDGTSLVKLRVYGDMTSPDRHAVLNGDLTKEVVRFLISKSRAGDGGRLRKPADGQFTYKNASAEVFIRCSYIPADRFGLEFDMVSVSLRLLPRVAKPIYLDELGLPALIKSEVSKALIKSQGLIVMSGPTNSGKSTTIAGIVGEHIKLFGASKKRLSVEDPVERYLEGITQISVDNNFADLMRHILRHDPDLVWVGEIRDPYSATACIRAATSGHVVLSTVHANNSILAFRAISNYLKKESAEAEGSGASIFDLAESISLLIGQRLIKRLCPHCKNEIIMEANDLALVKEYLDREGLANLWDKAKMVLSNKVCVADKEGCEDCNHSGFSGEFPIIEVLPVTRSVRDAFTSSSGDNFNFNTVAPHRLNTLFESALERVAAGEADPNTLFV